jgi:hypothetical protein
MTAPAALNSLTVQQFRPIVSPSRCMAQRHDFGYIVA